jgi:hypothetical protein
MIGDVIGDNSDEGDEEDGPEVALENEVDDTAPSTTTPSASATGAPRIPSTYQYSGLSKSMIRR